MDRWISAAPVPDPDGSGAVYPLDSGYGLVAASGIPEAFQGSSGLGSGTIFASRLWIPTGYPITSLWVAVQTGGTYTSGTPNLLGLYTDEGEQVATTADDPTLWDTAGWCGGPLVGGPVEAMEGRYVYVLFIATGYSGILLPYAPAGAHAAWYVSGPTTINRRVMYASATTLPASFDPQVYGTPTSYQPLVGVS